MGVSSRCATSTERTNCSSYFAHTSTTAPVKPTARAVFDSGSKPGCLGHVSSSAWTPLYFRSEMKQRGKVWLLSLQSRYAPGR